MKKFLIVAVTILLIIFFTFPASGFAGIEDTTSDAAVSTTALAPSDTTTTIPADTTTTTAIDDTTTTTISANTTATVTAPADTTTTAAASESTTTETSQLLDTTLPVIILNGDASINLNLGEMFTDPGVTARDDGKDLTASILVVSTVNTAKTGSYTISYNVSDAAGNAAAEVIRKVEVVEPVSEVDIIQTLEEGQVGAAVLENSKADSIELVSIVEDITAQDLITENAEQIPSLITDKPDYAPTDTVLIIGNGFIADKTYTLIISSTDSPPVNFEVQVIADKKGTFVYAYQLDGTYRPNYKVEVKDSKLLTTFTDSAPGVLFESNFDNMDGLTQLIGPWDIIDGNLKPIIDSVYEKVVVFGDNKWQDYDISVNADIVAGRGYGVYYRASVDVNNKVSGYIFQYIAWNKTFLLRKVITSLEFPAFITVNMPADISVFGSSHKIDISIEGDHHTIMVDGNSVMDFHDSDFTQGQAGFRTWASPDVSFEDAKVIDNKAAVVTKTTPVIIWSNPDDITYGTALGSKQLNAAAAVDGMFVYSPAEGTVLNEGSGQSLSVTFTPTDSDNYDTAVKTVLLSVVKANQIITFANPGNKIYGDAVFDLTASSTSGLAVNFSIISGPATLSGDSLTITGSGDVVIRASQTGNSNYNAADNIDQTFSVDRVAITVTADAKSKIYGDIDPELTYQITAGSLVKGDSFTGSLTRNKGEDIGTYAITQGTLSLSSNYTLTYIDGTITINSKALFESTFDNMNGLTQLVPYAPAWSILNGNLKPATDTTSEKILVFGDSKWQNYSVSVNAALIAGSGYGVYYRATLGAYSKISGYIFQYDPRLNKSFIIRKVVNGTESASPFKIASMPVGFSIFGTSHKIDISIEGDHHIIMVDGNNVMDFYDSDFALGMSGFRAWSGSDVNFEDVKVSDIKSAVFTKTTPVITWSNPDNITYGTALGSKQLNATSSIAGTFVYSPAEGTILNEGSGQSLSVTFTPTDSVNYDTSTKTVLLTVLKANQTISFANPGNKIYGDAAFDLAASSSSDLPISFSVISGPATLSGANLTITGVGDVVIRAEQPGNSNYNAADNVDQTFSVGKATITVSADAKNKIYGDADPIFTYQITSGSLAEGDSFTGFMSRVEGEDIGTYAIGQETLTLNSNYSLSFKGADLEVGAKSIEVTADAKSKIYGDADPELTYKITSGYLVNSDSFTGSLTRDKGEDIGTYSITQGTLSLSKNYTIKYINGTLNINSKVLFESNFDNMDGLKLLMGTWSIKDGNLRSLADNVFEKILVFGDSNWQDYSISVNAALIAGSGYGVYYRASLNANNKISGYIFQYDPGWHNTFVVRKVVDGKESAPIIEAIMPAGLNIFGSYHKIDIILEGDHHVIMVDGNKVMDFHYNQFTQGQAGFRTWNYSDVSFDDVKVTGKEAAVVTKTTPVITWSNPDNITYGTALGSKQLNAAASIAGTFVYSPAEGTILNEGSGQSLSVTFTPTDSVKYDTSTKTVLLTVLKANQTISFTNPGNKIYGDAAFDLAASSSSDLPISFSVISGPATLSGANLTITGVGDVVIRAAQAGNSNYNAADNVDQTFSIGKATITVTADAKSKIYGDADPILTYEITNGSLVEGDTFTGSLSRTEGEDIGIYAIGQGTLSLNTNYALSFKGADLSIGVKTIEITADAKSKVYGESDPELTFISTDLKAVFTGSLSRDEGEDVGDYTINSTLSAGKNYSVKYIAANLTIKPAELTVTADAKSKVYGDIDPELTYQITSGSLVKGDTFTGSLTRTEGEDIGTYAIGQGTLSLSKNYTVKYINDVLTINPKVLTVTVDNSSRIYGSENPVFTIKYSGFVKGDNSSSFKTQPIIKTDATAISPVGKYTINASGASSPNYKIDYKPGILTIDRAVLIISTNNALRLYGETNPVFTVQYSGFVLEDTLSSLTLQPVIKTNATQASPAGIYLINASGASSTNYKIYYKPGILIIDRAILIITANNASRQYGEKNPVFTAQYSGFALQDNPSSLILQPVIKTTATQTSLAGTYPINASGAFSFNYKIYYKPGILKVTYYWYGFLKPINTADTKSVFKLGSTIPVKFKIDGDVPKKTVAKISFSKVGNISSSISVNEAVSTSAATTGKLFRYSAAEDQYIYNLNTKNLTAGEYTIKAILDDGKEYSVNILLSAK